MRDLAIAGSWNCSICNLYNDILTVSCKDCQSYRPSELDFTAGLVAVRRNVFLTLGDRPVTEKEKLFAEFFNAGVSLVENMSIEEIIAHEERLNNIAFEAKATKEGVSKVKRERESRLTLAEKERLHSKDLEHNVSESLRTVEKRKTRITGKDQLNKDLVSMGLVGDDLKEILSQVTVTGKKKKLEAIKPAAKFVFNGTPKPLDDNGNPEVEKRIGQSINQPVPQVPNLNTDSELPTKTIFDPTKLFGKKD